MLNFSVAYRPKNFDEFFGNQRTVDELRKRVITDAIPNVIYFTGNSGCGKTTLQLIVAKAILCQDKDEKGNPCNVCATCQTINTEKESLFFFNYNCSNVDIDTARSIEELATMKTLSNVKKKVIVLDELQELYSNAKARKNLLKVLERQNKNTYFILGSMDDSKVDKAVKNRAVTYRLNNTSTSDLAKYLKHICDCEKVELDSDEKIKVVLSIASYCEGDFRQGVSLLERVVFSELWTESDIQKELNVITHDKMTEIISKLLNTDPTVFSNTFNKDFIDKIIPLVVTCYKKIKGVQVESWQEATISNIDLKNVTGSSLESLLTNLFELNKFAYTTNSLVDFYILKGYTSRESAKPEEPKRRRVAG
jgi:DNA polymerase-3 subunit gamma/tau